MEQSPQITPQVGPSAQCAKNFQTRLLAPWPAALPAIAINSEIIVGFDRTWALNYRLSMDSHDFAQQWLHIFTTALPSLSWIELMLFTEKARVQSRLPIKALWQHHGFREMSSSHDLAPFVLSLPQTTLDWLRDKKVGPQELQALKALKSDQEKPFALEFWPFLETLRLSRQEGVQALELWLELRLLGHSIDELTPSEGENPGTWVKRLKSRRYPETQRRDHAAQEWIESQIWPRPTQIRWMRHGDQTGLEIRLMVKKPADLSHTRKALEDIETLLTHAPESLWPKH